MVSTLQIQPVQFKFKLFVLITVVEAVVIAVLETFFPLVWTALIWLGISLFLTEMIWRFVHLSSITVDPVKSKSQKKHEKLI